MAVSNKARIVAKILKVSTPELFLICSIWVVVKIMVPDLGYPERDLNFDSYPIAEADVLGRGAFELPCSLRPLGFGVLGRSRFCWMCLNPVHVLQLLEWMLGSFHGFRFRQQRRGGSMRAP